MSLGFKTRFPRASRKSLSSLVLGAFVKQNSFPGERRPSQSIRANTHAVDSSKRSAYPHCRLPGCTLQRLARVRSSLVSQFRLIAIFGSNFTVFSRSRSAVFWRMSGEMTNTETSPARNRTLFWRCLKWLFLLLGERSAYKIELDSTPS
jgi:hypothetical protein